MHLPASLSLSLSLSLPFPFFLSLDGSDLLQQLTSLVVGSKLNVTVGEAQEDGSCSFSSDDLPTVSILASKHHVSGEELLGLTALSRARRVAKQLSVCLHFQSSSRSREGF